MSEMSKTMLITGTSRGIGKAVYDYFYNTYDVIGVSRTGNPDIKGDITDINFRNELIHYCTERGGPDVFINNAGIRSYRYMETMETNFIAAGHLMTEFYKKMNSGSSIINITSSCAVIHGYPSMTNWRIMYQTSKNALKKLSENLSESRTRNIRVTSLEPAHVDTEMTSGKENEALNVPAENYNKQDIDVFLPMKVEYIAETIEWVLNQPPWVQISNLRLLNMHNKELAEMPVDTR